MSHTSWQRHAAALAALSAVSLVRAQAPNATTSAPGGAVTFPPPSGVSTTYTLTSYNTVSTATYLTQTDFSNERLAFLWDQVGPVATGPVTTTVTPTPEPSAYPSPGTFHPLVPAYEPDFNNFTLPRDFVWGVASSSYQIEVMSRHSHSHFWNHPTD